MYILYIIIYTYNSPIDTFPRKGFQQTSLD